MIVDAGVEDIRDDLQPGKGLQDLKEGLPDYRKEKRDMVGGYRRFNRWIELLNNIGMIGGY